MISGSWDQHWTFYGRLSLILVAPAALLLGHWLPVGGGIEALEGGLRSWGAWAALVFVAVFFLDAILLLPVWPLTFLAGALFGPLWGALLVSASSTAEAALAFVIARYLAREKIARMARKYGKFGAVDRAIGAEGWKIVALLRLTPAIPFGLQNYLYGLTSIRFWPCVLASWLAMLPSTVVTVYAGYLGATGLAAAAEGQSPFETRAWVLRTIGLAAALAATAYIAFRA